MTTDKTVVTMNGLSGAENYEKIRGTTLFLSRDVYNELSSVYSREFGASNFTARVDKFVTDMEALEATDGGVSSTNETDLYLGSLGLTAEYPHKDKRS